MPSSNLARYLTIRILYPKPDHLNDVLSVVKSVSEEARKHTGPVETDACSDSKTENVADISLWGSEE